MESKDSEEDVEIISSEDDRMKLIGEIFSNDSTQKILKLISNGTDMTANEISQKTNMSLSLVRHHLNRMRQVGMVKITKTGTSVKGQKMKYYLATKQSFLIVPPEKETRSIFESLWKFSKFTAIGLAGLVSWLILKPENNLPGSPAIDSDQSIFTGSDESNPQVEEWSSGQEIHSSADVDKNLDQELINEREPQPEPEPEPEPEPQVEPTPQPEPEPSHSGVVDFELQVDSNASNTGSVSLDRTVYPEPFGFNDADSIERLIISILVPVGIIVGGIILDRIISRWIAKRKATKTN